ncbi:MAG TPA: hypothetical protein VIH48_03080 [Candidatus Bathyarchaeia archaeon]
MSKAKIPKFLSPCGLNCSWCVYRKTETSESGCPGCFKREKCSIRDCANEDLKQCSDCVSFPCYEMLQGYQCMKEHYTF